MPTVAKLVRNPANAGHSCARMWPSLGPSDTGGTCSSSTSSVIAIANTPSLNASSRVVSFSSRTADLRAPGIHKWDITAQKSVLIHEGVSFKFLAEFYNAFNHTQFSGVDSAARFDTIGQQVNTGLGRVTNARSARVIQLALAFRF